MDGPELAPYPPWVQTPEELRRWDAAYGIAEGLSKLYEESGEPDPRWVWYTTRALYNDTSIPTTDETVQEAEGDAPDELDDDALFRRSRALLAELESRKPTRLRRP